MRSKTCATILNVIRTVDCLEQWRLATGDWEAASHITAVALAITGPWDTNVQWQAQDKHTQYACGLILMDSHIAHIDRRQRIRPSLSIWCSTRNKKGY